MITTVRHIPGPLAHFGLELSSGSLTRDLMDGRRVLVRRGEAAQIRAIDKRRREVEVVASTSGVKRDGNAIVHSDTAWDFTNFAKNPAMLWSHDYGSAFAPPGLPLGSWKSWGIEKVDGANALCATGEFEDDEFPDRVFRRVCSGTIRAVSIGWNPLEYEELLDDKGNQVGWLFTRNELYEISWVVIGADPSAGVRSARPTTLTDIRIASERLAAEVRSTNLLREICSASRRLETVTRTPSLGAVERKIDLAMSQLTKLIGAPR